jgi:BirA family transcriptional regulator, biotin operon repressor / biotin---[acetyl-CoA-carboxylase] ligase
MLERTLHWGAEDLWQQLEPLLPGLTVEVLARTESTNSLLLERSRAAGHRRDDVPDSGFSRRAEDVQPCLLVAELQTRGRGRMGRVWHAESGSSLTFSLSLPLHPVDWSGMSLAVGVALADALDPIAAGAAPRIGLKWPNDLWWAGGHDLKLGGVLIETASAGSSRLAVVGVGINVAPQRGTPGAASLLDIGIALDAPAALQRVALPLVQALQQFEAAGFAPFAERFAARDVLRGRAISTTLPELPEGEAAGVDEGGALRVLHDGRERRIASGEVSVRPVKGG